MSSVMKQFQASSHLFGANAPFVEELYEQYLADPASVAPEWRDQFDSWQLTGSTRDVAHSGVIASLEGLTRTGAAAAPAASGSDDGKSLKVLQYIRAHRVMGARES